MRRLAAIILTVIMALTLASCSLGTQSTPVVTTTGASSTTSTSSTTAASTDQTAAAAPTAVSVVEALADNSATHEAAEDTSWDAAEAITITLDGSTISANAQSVKVDGSTATIAASGTYILSGTLSDGQILVDTQSEAAVKLVLNGASLASSSGSALTVLNAEKVILILAENTQNSVSDGSNYAAGAADSAETDTPNAAIYSKSDLTIAGSGALTVNGNSNDGIASKDGLIIAGGSLTVTAVDDGIRGKDYLVVQDGTLTVNAGGDGLKSDNETDAAKGYISIENGVFNVTSGGDAIAAQTDLLIAGGDFTLTSEGGSAGNLAADASAKGLKGVATLSIDAGTFVIDSADDALHSNGSLTVNGGTFTLATGDDGMHADAALIINGGDIAINQSYEGIESAVITINAGNIQVVSSDDGINVASGVDGSGAMRPGGRPGGQTDTFSYTGSNYLYIHGGEIYVDALGDGVDVNGAIEMSAGLLVVSGPTAQNNGALDYDGGFNLTGGLVVAAGSSGMAMAPGAYSSQNSILVYLSATQSAGTIFHLQNSAGEDILTFAPAHDYQSVAFSSADLVSGETYTIILGGSSSGSAAGGLIQGGAYSGGSEYGTFSVSQGVTQVGSGGRGPR
jgi:hypothetical protein